MNIGIIIGVSEYTSESNLPGCFNDAESINEILKKTGKYDELFYINEKINSAVVKEKLTNFITNNKQNKVDELFFYFTGHGDFVNEKFYYLLSDYNHKQRNQTSLENSEIDTLIKSLNPKLVVKVIDACHSGKSYIKEANVVKNYFDNKGKEFNNCYFLNSSLVSQSSYQSDEISYFTASFINSLKNHKSEDIRYKDIIDFISDEFEKSSLNQTPFFIIQADYTEKFTKINDSLKSYLDSLIIKNQSFKIIESNQQSIVDKVIDDSRNYITKKEAFELVDSLPIIINNYQYPDFISELFDCDLQTEEDYDSIIDENVISNWLDENDHEYFAKSKIKKVYENPYLPVLKSSLGISSEESIDYKVVRDGFESIVSLPYNTIVLDINSKYPNLSSYTVRIVYFLSKKKIIFFYFKSKYDEINWDEKKINSDINWYNFEAQITDEQEVQNTLEKIIEEIVNQIENDIEKLTST